MTTADSFQTQRSEIVFIESNVTDYATLIAGLDPALEVHVLDSLPTEAQTQALTSYIEDHGQADFIAAVAGLHLNVDLVGLQQSGVEYV